MTFWPVLVAGAAGSWLLPSAALGCWSLPAAPWVSGLAGGGRRGFLACALPPRLARGRGFGVFPPPPGSLVFAGGAMGRRLRSKNGRKPKYGRAFKIRMPMPLRS